MTEIFTEAEQEEIISEFLSACGEKQEEPEEHEDFKAQYDKLLLTSANHIFQLKQLETKSYVPIKQAILKFIEQAQNGRNYLNEPLVYTPKLSWYKNLQKYHCLEIQKQGTRYVCSKERLEYVDFKIIEAPSKLYQCRHYQFNNNNNSHYYYYFLLSIISQFVVIDFREVFGLGEVFRFGRF